VEGLINKAGRQRMLGQRIVKNYVLLATGQSIQAAGRELSDSIDAFDRQLDELAACARDAQTRDAVALTEREWLSFRSLALAPYAREGVRPLCLASERLLLAAEHTTAIFLKGAVGAAARLVNLAGRERMLAQRIAKSYVLLAEKYDEAATRQELTLACVEFGRALGELRAAPANGPELRAELAEAAAVWRRLLALVREDLGAAKKVLAAAEDLLSRMERVTSLYEQ
jgi:Type IV pili methyl-accepting chemotaxis transducer N-term